MAEVLASDKVAFQFLYPFKIARWETLRHGLGTYIEEFDRSLYSRLREMQDGLDERLGPYAPRVFDPVTGALGETGRLDRRGISQDASDASVLSAIRDYIRHDRSMANHAFQDTDDPVAYELLEVVRIAEAQRPQNAMQYVAERLTASGLPLLRPAEYWAGDDRGTRGYLERKQPQVEARLSAGAVSLVTPDVLPDVASLLPQSEVDSREVGCRITPVLRVMSSGFGCLTFKIRLCTEQGLLDRASEVAFTAEAVDGLDRETVIEYREALAKDLQDVVVKAVATRDFGLIDRVLEDYSARFHIDVLRVPLQSLVDGVTVVSAPLIGDAMVDVANIDRGYARGLEPQLRWTTGDTAKVGTLWDYFRYIAEDMCLSRLSRSILADERLAEFIGKSERRANRAGQFSAARNEILNAVSALVLDASPATLEEHPYVCTFISAPPGYKASPTENLTDATQHFAKMLDTHRKDLTQVLMKSKWAGIRSDWSTTTHPMDNLFYSDLIFMAVDIRSAMCLHYAPATAAEYALIPELAHGYKYLDELTYTLQDQRMLWYAYSNYEWLVTQDIKAIATALEEMKEDALEERFSEVIEGLTAIVNGIDKKKTALAEMMHDPLSRKGGSSLYSGLLSKTTEAFQLDALYHNLENKMDRLDMLGLHVAENVQQYSSLVVQEGTRSAQFTLEFLEAFIIGFYFAELAELSLPEHIKESVWAMSQWWAFYAVSLGTFLTALPIITLIRRGRSRFNFDNPSWLETLERVGIICGPAILIALVFLGVAYRPIEVGAEEFAWTAQAPLLAVLALFAYAVIVAAWYRLEHAGERVRGYRRWWQLAWLSLHRD